MWRGGKIDHHGGEHDDWSNAAAGCVHQLLNHESVTPDFWQAGDFMQTQNPDETPAQRREREEREQRERDELTAIRAEHLTNGTYGGGWRQIN